MRRIPSPPCSLHNCLQKEYQACHGMHQQGLGGVRAQHGGWGGTDSIRGLKRQVGGGSHIAVEAYVYDPIAALLRSIPIEASHSVSLLQSNNRGLHVASHEVGRCFFSTIKIHLLACPPPPFPAPLASPVTLKNPHPIPWVPSLHPPFIQSILQMDKRSHSRLPTTTSCLMQLPKTKTLAFPCLLAGTILLLASSE